MYADAYAWTDLRNAFRKHRFSSAQWTKIASNIFHDWQEQLQKEKIIGKSEQTHYTDKHRGTYNDQRVKIAFIRAKLPDHTPVYEAVVIESSLETINELKKDLRALARKSLDEIISKI